MIFIKYIPGRASAGATLTHQQAEKKKQRFVPWNELLRELKEFGDSLPLPGKPKKTGKNAKKRRSVASPKR